MSANRTPLTPICLGLQSSVYADRTNVRLSDKKHDTPRGRSEKWTVSVQNCGLLP